MPYHANSTLWPNDGEHYFRDRNLRPLLQSGPHCVSTSLAMLTDATPEHFQRSINTQDPVSWSEALRPFGMKLAYCPTDARKVEHYLPELLRLDDLFTISYYTPDEPAAILRDPNDAGWVCGSHIVVLHRDRVLDPAWGQTIAADAFRGRRFHTKRVFRVVPSTHSRGV